MKYKHTVRTLYKLNRAEKKDIQNKHFKNVMLMEEPETVETLVPQAELPEPELPEEPQSEPAAEPMQKPKKKKSAAVITATIIFIVGIIFAIIYFSNNTDNYSYDIFTKTLTIRSDDYFESDYEKFRGTYDAPSYKINKVIINNGVTKIGKYAFEYCTNLTSITIPDSVTEIGFDAFYNCTSLTSIIIPDSVTEIGWNAFYGWTDKQTIYIKGRSEAPSGWDSNWNKYCKAKIVWNAFSESSDTESSNVEVTDKYTFDNYTKTLTVLSDAYFESDYEKFRGTNDAPSYKINKVIINNGVTEIGIGAFWYCASLTSITIPDSVTEIGGFAFYNCTSLTSITIPDSVTYIGSWAFDNWTGKQKIYIKGRSEAPIGWDSDWNRGCYAKIVWNA